jgi:3-deoxy-D-manno-octulosonic-acid transferase
MSRRAYSILLYGALPVAMLWTWWRGWRHAAYRDSVRARLALGLAVRADHPLWLHAASVGEVRALVPLIQSYADPGTPLLVTVGTPTGLARARALVGRLRHVTVQALPWDLPGAVARFMAANRPRAGVFVETELWPNLIAAANAAGVPLALVSARMSERSLHRYLRWAPRLMRQTVSGFAAVGAQGEPDRARFAQLGATVTSITGNLKYDLQLPPEVAVQGAALRAQWSPQRPLWVAGSTHPGEEEHCLAAHRLLLAAARGKAAAPPVLALAPRRPERFEAVWQSLQAQGFATARSSQPAASRPVADVVLVDEMGVLPAWYAAADVAFVGGSLAPVGGHNLLEPAMLGRPVLAGPHQFNAPEVSAGLLAAQGMQVVTDASTLAAVLAQWLGNPQEAAAIGAKAAAAAAANRGAILRVRALVAALTGA